MTPRLLNNLNVIGTGLFKQGDRVFLSMYTYKFVSMTYS